MITSKNHTVYVEYVALGMMRVQNLSETHPCGVSSLPSMTNGWPPTLQVPLPPELKTSPAWKTLLSQLPALAANSTSTSRGALKPRASIHLHMPKPTQMALRHIQGAVGKDIDLAEAAFADWQLPMEGLMQDLKGGSLDGCTPLMPHPSKVTACPQVGSTCCQDGWASSSRSIAACTHVDM